MLRFHLADVYSAQQRWTEAKKIYRYLLATYPDSQELRQVAYLGLLPILDQESRYLEEENILWKIIRFEQSQQTLERLDSFYGRMIKQFPKDVDWRYKNAIFWMEIKRDVFRAMSDFQAIVDIDTSYPARAYLHARIGEHYLRFNKEKALVHLRKSLDALPGQASTAYSLASAYLHLNRNEEALAVLDSLYKNNQINLPNCLKLADLKALSGDYTAADSLFRKAEAIRIDTVLGLYEGMGKSALLNQKPEEALLLYQKEFALQPQNPALAYTIARLYARTQHPAEALVWLDRTFNLGFRRPMVLKYEADWNPLRERAEWKEMMKKYFPKKDKN
ncbi:MAG: tetratricopeptide repeat protein [Saprospiraceae bacterium]|nr:tetratricopeptide repeat protein [Saprospiraceae bacterium]